MDVNPRRLAILLLLTAFASACVGPLGSATPTSSPELVDQATATPSPRTAQLSELDQQVDARDADNAEWQAAQEGQQISAGGGARTGEASRVRIDVSDGSIIRIAANTVFQLLELSPQADDPLTRLKLDAGKIFTLLNGGALDVETPTGIATVRGSLMSVDQTLGTGRLVITCLEGACRLSDPSGANAVDLTAGQQSDIPAPGLPPQPARPMDRVQIDDWLQNFPEAQTIAQALLNQLGPEETPTPSLPPPPAGFNVSGSGAASTPHLAFDGQGALHVVWEDQSLRPLGDYFHRQLNPDGQWSEVQNLTEGFEFLYGSLDLVRGLDGQMCVMWNGATTGSDTIGLYRVCQTDAGWPTPEIIKLAPGTARDFAVGLAPDGTLAEIHLVGAGDLMFDDLALSGGELAVLPQLVVDARGDIHAAWVSLGQQSGEPFTVVHRHRYTVEGGSQQLWLDPDVLSAPENSPDALSLKLAADAQGGVHIAWSGNGGVNYRRWTLIDGWGETVTVSSESAGLDLDLAVGADGLARVIWSRLEGAYYAAQDANGTWSQPRLIVEVAVGLQSAERPHLVVDDQGVTHLVWVTNKDVFYLTLP
jgi:hypothetical protein